MRCVLAAALLACVAAQIDYSTLLALIAGQGAGRTPSALLNPRNGPGIPVFDTDPRLQNDPIAYYRQHGRPVAEGIPISNVNQVVHNTKHRTKGFEMWDGGAESALFRAKDYNFTTTTTAAPRTRASPPPPMPGAYPSPYMNPWYPPMYPGFPNPYAYPPPFNPYGGGYPPRPHYPPRRHRPKPKKTEGAVESVEDDGSEGTGKMETKERNDISEGTKKNTTDTAPENSKAVTKGTTEADMHKTANPKKGLSSGTIAVDRINEVRKDEVMGDTKNKDLADTIKVVAGNLEGETPGEGTKGDVESTGESTGEGTKEDATKGLVKISGGSTNSATVPARKKNEEKKKGGKKQDAEKDAKEDENGSLETVEGEVKVPSPVDGDTGENEDDDEKEEEDEEEENNEDELVGRSKKKGQRSKTKGKAKKDKKKRRKEKEEHEDEDEDEEEDDNKNDGKNEKKKEKKNEDEEEEEDDEEDEGDDEEDKEEDDDADHHEEEKENKAKDKKKKRNMIKGQSSGCTPRASLPSNYPQQGKNPAQGYNPSPPGYSPPGQNSYATWVTTTTWRPTTTQWDPHKDDYHDFDAKKCANEEDSSNDAEEDDVEGDDQDEEVDGRKKKNKKKKGRKGKEVKKGKGGKKKRKAKKGKRGEGKEKKKEKKSDDKFRSLDYLTSKEKIDNAKRNRGQILDELHASDDLKRIRSKASVSTPKTICSSEKDEYPTKCMAWRDAGYCETNQATRFLWCRKTCYCGFRSSIDSGSRTKRRAIEPVRPFGWLFSGLLGSLRR